jgi:transposase-like protein
VSESESAEEWLKLFNDIKARGKNDPKAIIGDGGKGLWAATDIIFKSAVKISCWVHKCREVMRMLPRKAKIYLAVMESIKLIYNAADKDKAMQAFLIFKAKFGQKHSEAVKAIESNLEQLLAFYFFDPALHVYLRTSNPIESLFSVIRLRTNRFRGCCRFDNLKDTIFITAIRTSVKLKSICMPCLQDPVAIAIESLRFDEDGYKALDNGSMPIIPIALMANNKESISKKLQYA